MSSHLFLLLSARVAAYTDPSRPLGAVPSYLQHSAICSMSAVCLDGFLPAQTKDNVAGYQPARWNHGHASLPICQYDGKRQRQVELRVEQLPFL